MHGPCACLLLLVLATCQWRIPGGSEDESTLGRPGLSSQIPITVFPSPSHWRHWGGEPEDGLSFSLFITNVFVLKWRWLGNAREETDLEEATSSLTRDQLSWRTKLHTRTQCPVHTLPQPCSQGDNDYSQQILGTEYWEYDSTSNQASLWAANSMIKNKQTNKTTSLGKMIR